MHQAKAAARNTICFFAPALQTAVNARAQLEDDIRQAIETRQFELYYQPQVERKRPEFPSGMTAGLRTTMSSWVMSGR
jgi:predicted signal transduction protein with EAL and GGDEF domain